MMACMPSRPSSVLNVSIKGKVVTKSFVADFYYPYFTVNISSKKEVGKF